MQPATNSKPAPSAKPELLLVCSISGLKLGNFQPADYSSLGTSPFLAQWKRESFIHPVFSLAFGEVVRKATACWMLEKEGKRQYTMQYKQLIMLALLHSSGLLKQDIPALPSPVHVEKYFARILEMMDWKMEVASSKLHLPKLHVWHGAAFESAKEPFASLGPWLDACDVCKDEWENVVRTNKARAKELARVAAMRNIRKNLYEDISLRRLWNWVVSQVDTTEMANNQDLEEVFFVAEKNINTYDLEDIQALEDLFIANCELGNSISHEVQKRIDQLAQWRTEYADAFEIVIENEFPEMKGVARPVVSDFTFRAAFTIADARWQLANRTAPAPATTNKPLTQKTIKNEDL